MSNNEKVLVCLNKIYTLLNSTEDINETIEKKIVEYTKLFSIEDKDISERIIAALHDNQGCRLSEKLEDDEINEKASGTDKGSTQVDTKPKLYSCDVTNNAHGNLISSLSFNNSISDNSNTAKFEYISKSTYYNNLQDDFIEKQTIFEGKNRYSEFIPQQIFQKMPPKTFPQKGRSNFSIGAQEKQEDINSQTVEPHTNQPKQLFSSLSKTKNHTKTKTENTKLSKINTLISKEYPQNKHVHESSPDLNHTDNTQLRRIHGYDNSPDNIPGCKYQYSKTKDKIEPKYDQIDNQQQQRQQQPKYDQFDYQQQQQQQPKYDQFDSLQQQPNDYQLNSARQQKYDKFDSMQQQKLNHEQLDYRNRICLPHRKGRYHNKPHCKQEAQVIFQERETKRSQYENSNSRRMAKIAEEKLNNLSQKSKITFSKEYQSNDEDSSSETFDSENDIKEIRKIQHRSKTTNFSNSSKERSKSRPWRENKKRKLGYYRQYRASSSSESLLSGETYSYSYLTGRRKDNKYNHLDKNISDKEIRNTERNPMLNSEKYTKQKIENKNVIKENSKNRQRLRYYALSKGTEGKGDRVNKNISNESSDITDDTTVSTYKYNHRCCKHSDQGKLTVQKRRGKCNKDSKGLMYKTEEKEKDETEKNWRENRNKQTFPREYLYTRKRKDILNDGNKTAKGFSNDDSTNARALETKEADIEKSKDKQFNASNEYEGKGKRGSNGGKGKRSSKEAPQTGSQQKGNIDIQEEEAKAWSDYSKKLEGGLEESMYIEGLERAEDVLPLVSSLPSQNVGRENRLSFRIKKPDNKSSKSNKKKDDKNIRQNGQNLNEEKNLEVMHMQNQLEVLHKSKRLEETSKRGDTYLQGKGNIAQRVKSIEEKDIQFILSDSDKELQKVDTGSRDGDNEKSDLEDTDEKNTRKLEHTENGEEKGEGQETEMNEETEEWTDEDPPVEEEEPEIERVPVKKLECPDMQPPRYEKDQAYLNAYLHMKHTVCQKTDEKMVEELRKLKLGREEHPIAGCLTIYPRFLTPHPQACDERIIADCGTLCGSIYPHYQQVRHFLNWC